MKKIVLILLSISIILSTNNSFAIEKKFSPNPKRIEIFNTKKNIIQAELLEKEVKSFRSKLKKIQKSY
jgi:hypothetical protein